MERGKFTVTVLGPNGEVKDYYEAENPLKLHPDAIRWCHLRREGPPDDSHSLGCIGTVAYYFYIVFLLGSVVGEVLFLGWLIYKILQL